MAEDPANASPAASPDGNEPQTVEIPLSANPQAKEGDTIQLKVVSVDQENGVINAVPAQAAPADAGGSDSMAEEFNEPKS